MNWDKYDQWRLATPYDNEPDIEVFKVNGYEYYHTDEGLIDDFDKEVKETFTKRSKDESRDFEELAEELSDFLGLFSTEFDAIESYLENEKSEREYALERRWEEERERRQDEE